MTENLSIEEKFRDIEYNIGVIRENIASAAKKSGRSPGDITLMAVTKTVEPIFINHALSCGINLIGENKVQELLKKKPFLADGDWTAHLIGHLQTNKVRQIVGNVSMIQSVDSEKLASEIEKQSALKETVTDCLVEVNIGEEEGKTGIKLEDVRELIYKMSEMEHLRVKGLMAIPPICEKNDILNGYFLKMHKLFIDIGTEKIDNVSMDFLSMGMSSDYVNAIECGANLVRVGSSIFGRRLY